MIKRVRLTCLTLTSIAAMLFFSSCAKKEEQLHATIETNHGTIVVKLYEQKTPKTVANFVGLADGSKLLEAGQESAEPKPFYDGLTFHRVIPDFMIQGGCPTGDGTGDPGYKFEDECYTPGELVSGQITDVKTAEAVFVQVILPHLRENQGKSPVEPIAALFAEMNEARSFEPMLNHTVEEFTEALSYEGEIRAQGELISEVSYGKLCMANSGPNTNGSQFFIVTKKDGATWLNGKHTVFGEVIQGMDVAEAIQAVEKDSRDMPKEPVIIESIRTAHVKVKIEKAPKEEAAKEES